MRQAGFTLLELMIAILLFSIISLASYKLFDSVTQAQRVSKSVLDRLDIMQRAEVVVEKDFFQVVSRSVRNVAGEKSPALKSPADNGVLIEFTRSGWNNPLWEIRSNLQRVAYAREGDDLIRYYWPMLDRAPETSQIRQTVLSGVKDVKFRFFDEKKKWKNTWPPAPEKKPNRNRNRNRSKASEVDKMPVAVEITIQHEQYGSMVTVVPMSTFLEQDDEEELDELDDIPSFLKGFLP